MHLRVPFVVALFVALLAAVPASALGRAEFLFQSVGHAKNRYVC